jgi:hypothetical protein
MTLKMLVPLEYKQGIIIQMRPTTPLYYMYSTKPSKAVKSNVRKQNSSKADISKCIYNSLMNNNDKMKNTTQLTLIISTIATLLGLTVVILTSGGFFPSHTPAFGQEDDLGSFSIMNTTELTSGTNSSRVYEIPQQEEATLSPPSSESPTSESPQSTP